MSESREDPGPNAVDRRTEEALLWFTRMQGAGSTGADCAAFEAWLAADSRNGASYRRVTALWESPELAAALAEDARPVGPSTAAAWPRLRYAVPAAAILACVALLDPFADALRYLGADCRTAAGGTRPTVLQRHGAAPERLGRPVAPPARRFSEPISWLADGLKGLSRGAENIAPGTPGVRMTPC